MAENWKTFTLGDLIEINNQSISRNLSFDEIEYIDTSSVTENIFGEVQKFKIEHAPSRAKRLVANNDIIYSTVRPIQKHYGFISNVKPNTVVSTGFAVLTPKKIDPKFLYYYLSRAEIVGFLNGVAESNTTTFPAFNASLFEVLEINAPESIEEQRRIAEILSALDEKIELNLHLNATLEKIAQAIFKQWFVDFQFPDFDGKLVDGLPQGWRKGKLGEVLELAYGKALKSENRIAGEYPVIGSSGIVGFHNEFYVEGAGIVIGRKGTIGEVIWIDENFFPIDTTFFVKDLLGVKNLFFHFYLLQKQNFKNISSDSAVPGLNKNEAMRNEVVIPENKVILQFNEIAKSILEKKSFLKAENQTLTQIRDGLLPKLMSGKIRVSA